MVREITEAEFNEQFADKPINFLLDVYQDWCGPCKKLAPILEDMEKKYPKVVFLKMNASRNPGFCRKFAVTCYPFVMFFENGKLLDQVRGLSLGNIEAKLGKLSA